MFKVSVVVIIHYYSVQCYKDVVDLIPHIGNLSTAFQNQLSTGRVRYSRE